MQVESNRRDVSGTPGYVGADWSWPIIMRDPSCPMLAFFSSDILLHLLPCKPVQKIN